MTIQAPVFDPVTAFGIAALAWLVAGVWVWLFGLRQRRLTTSLAAGALVVFGLSAVAAVSGWLQRTEMPQPMAIMLLVVLAGTCVLGFSGVGRSAAAQVPLVSLVAFQSFRLPLELVMHRAARLGIMPEELSYSGYNMDIATGAGALVLSIAMAAGQKVPRGLLWAWNLWGCWCLAVIVFLAVASSPAVRLFGEVPHVNTWVMFLPYVWLPVVLVTAALFGHIVMTRALVSGRSA
jgi:hypothetical protein